MKEKAGSGEHSETKGLQTLEGQLSSPNKENKQTETSVSMRKKWRLEFWSGKVNLGGTN